MLSRTTPILRSFDEVKAREFYVSFLGFDVVFEHRFHEAPLSTWASAEVTATCICPSTMATRRRALRCASRSRMWMRSATNCARETTPMLDHRSRTHLGTRVTSLYRIPSGTGSLSPVPSAPELNPPPRPTFLAAKVAVKLE